MQTAADYKANADRCAVLAKEATSETDRKVWLGMQRYWLARLSTPSANNDPPLIENVVDQ
jgi:hypothetical protein